MARDYLSDNDKPSRKSNTVEIPWVEQVQQGSRSAFKKIFNAYYEPLLCFSFRYVKNRAEAEGVVQDVFLWIWENRHDWHVQGSLKTYLFRAVKHKCLDILKHQKVRRNFAREQSVINDNNVLPETMAGFDEDAFKEAAEEAIEELPERARIIYKMNRLEGLTYNEIADVLGISPKTVESQMTRSLKKLRDRLSNFLSLFLVVKKMAETLF